MLVKGLKSDHQIDTLFNVDHLRVRERIASTGVAAGWATESGAIFGGGIIDEIPRGTSALEGMIKSDPVTSEV